MTQTLAKLLRDAPWHKESFEALMHERLPRLLGERLPLVAYSAEATGEAAYTVHVALAGSSGVVQGKYRDVPGPNAQGVIPIDGTRRVVMPVATDRDLATAQIKCVGDQFFDFIAARLGQAPDDLVWDEALLATWFPLNDWVTEFLSVPGRMRRLRRRSTRGAGLSAGQSCTAWLFRSTSTFLLPGDAGRTCPFMMPEGPNIYRLRSIASGAAVRDGRLVVVDERPEAGLSTVTALIPFLEHNDPSRLLMGSNMLRQWIAPPDPEPALVQTGNEPAEREGWLGHNLLTAYVSWGPDTHAYGIALSESAACRLRYPGPMEPGDKLSNRHGTKGVVARILPDDDMPHLADGTPVELVYSFLRSHTTLEFGDIREAMLSRVARAAGAPVVVPPYQAPSEQELRDRLAAAGPPSLRYGNPDARQGRPTAGSSEHGRLGLLGPAHPPGRRQARRSSGRFGGPEQRSTGTDQTETYPHGRSGRARWSIGPTAMPALSRTSPSATTRGRLRGTTLRRWQTASWLETCLSPAHPARCLRSLPGDYLPRASAWKFADSRLRFAYAQPEGEVLALAQPVPHPWWPERALAAVGARPDLPSYRALVETNDRVARFVADGVPEQSQGAGHDTACQPGRHLLR